ncbi:prenyltransferase/squalene oxidase repeat-containing protein [Frigoriglobus tundricola]|uniref:Squalene cyclase C-terminal domain-containing protein n=1 Tax=Frigoriglobus tundricola TaxID=2774151 RepID=A0A6M5Z2M6_9BACT|nr:prenyltransferase/squalene oxidase repeat-containing protein [Frigoriglobus tundricola]QJW99442.1 hypothetical protein FTUN_7054 [Frigoriglobus tundricola]
MPFPSANADKSRRQFLATAAAGAAGLWARPAFGQQNKAGGKSRLDAAVSRGLEWLKKGQARDGHWDVGGGRYSVAMTALAGMCFLMEGSTLREGKYTDQVKKAVDWLTAPAHQKPNGAIADSSAPGELDSYMHGHGYATMFLASAYGEAEGNEEQRKLERAVTRAVDFTAKAQTRKKHPLAGGGAVEVGGWGYVSAADRDFDEGSVTATQLQALRAARNAAIPVPKETIALAVAYLEACTTPQGGIIYSYTLSGGRAVNGEERPALTAAAVCCGFSAGDYSGTLPKKWIKFCKDRVPVAAGRVPHDEYTNYYFAQFLYGLGDDRYARMFPTEAKDSALTWSKYRSAMFPYLLEQQTPDGSWTSGYIGAVFATAVNLTILQLEKDQLPIYQC